MSKMAWERAAGTAAKLATVSVIAALAATTAVAAESANHLKKPGAKVPASYGQPVAQPAWGQPQFRAPSYGQPQFGAPVYGEPQFGAPVYGQPQFGAPAYGQPQFGAPQFPRQAIAPASAVTPNGPKLPAGNAPTSAKAPLGQHKAAAGQAPAHPQFGQRIPIFANTQANGITYGPPSYTPPKDFDPKLASSSPFPSEWTRRAWAQQQRPPAPNFAGAPVYGNGWGRRIQPASASQYAPAEPTYAPAEPLRPNYKAATAPAAPAKYESITVAPADAPEKKTAKVVPSPASTSTYSYQGVTTSALPSYVGQSTDFSSTTYKSNAATSATANPYEVVIGQSGHATTTASAYQPTSTYQAAPAYQTATTPNFKTASIPAYQPATAPAYQAAPSYQTTTAPAHQTVAPVHQTAAIPTFQAAPSYEAAPIHQSATTYEAAPAYQAATPTTYEAAPVQQSVTTTFESAPAYQSATPTTYEAAPSYQSATPTTTYQAAPAYQSATPTTYEAAPSSSYQSATPTTYEAAPAYQSATPTTYEAAPAYETSSNASSYEMTTEAAPIYSAGTSYSAQGYETVASTTAPAYEAAPAYQSTDYSSAYGTSSSSFSSGNNHFVQVGAFRNPARAERLVRKLQGAGEQAIITQATVRGKLFHRVRVPAIDKRDASAVRSRIRGLGYYEARTVRG